MANRIFFWIFFVLMLICLAALGLMIWESTGPEPGANMILMGLPFLLGPMALFALLTGHFGIRGNRQEGIIGWIAIAIAAATFLLAIAGISFA